MATVVAEKIIRIDVVTSAGAQRAIRALADDMKKVETSTAQMQRSITSGFGNMTGMLTKLSSFLGAFGVAVGFGAIAKAVLDSASAYQVLEQRLALVLGTTKQASEATRDIFEIAKITGREIDGVSKLYEKASRSAQQYGFSQETVRQITLGFSQAIRLSGSSTSEANAALIQFGQALASGRLQGDEFRSLMENNAVFMFEFAKAAGFTVTELRKMGTEGKLSSKFLFETLTKVGGDGINMLQRLDKQAKQLPLTFRESFTSLGTSVTQFVGLASKALDLQGEDKLGFFGNWIRALDILSGKLRELNAISNAQGEGFFEKMLRYGKLALPFVGGTALTPFGEGGKPYARRIEDETAAVKAALDKAQTQVERMAKINKDKEKAGVIISEVDRLASQEAQAEVEKLNQKYINMRKLQSDVSYGDRYVEPNKPPPVKAEPDKKIETAREALARYIVNLTEQRDLQKALLANEALDVQVMEKKLDLTNKLKDANISANSAQAKGAFALLNETEMLKKRIEARDQYKKAVAEESSAVGEESKKVTEIMQRDVATMEALRTDIKASQEYSTDKLERGLKRATDQRNALLTFSKDQSDDPLIIAADELVRKYKEALGVRQELTEAQAIEAQGKAQNIVDRENFKRVDTLAEEINRDLKQGIAEGDAGKSLYENLQKTFKEKAIDVVINPVTTLMSRALAQLADQFSKMLSQQLAASIANQSSDPIGLFSSLMQFGAPSFGGAGGIPSVYSLPIGGVKLGYPLAEGMSYVPFDNFPATLHRGERVLTAQENSNYGGRGAITISHNPNIMIDSRTDRAQVFEIAFAASRQGNAALVEELRAQGVM